MIKLFANIVLIGILLISQLYNSFVMLSYQVNYDYYAEELCENKEEPELHCDGQCFFAKQLALDEDKSKSSEPPTLLPSLRLFPAPDAETTLLSLLEVSGPSVPAHDQILPRDIFLSGIDHPPQV